MLRQTIKETHAEITIRLHDSLIIPSVCPSVCPLLHVSVCLSGLYFMCLPVRPLIHVLIYLSLYVQASRILSSFTLPVPYIDNCLLLFVSCLSFLLFTSKVAFSTSSPFYPHPHPHTYPVFIYRWSKQLVLCWICSLTWNSL